MKRIYLDRKDCNISRKKIYIRSDTFHYLKKVLRMKEGDVFTGFDGTGLEYIIQVSSIKNILFEGVILKTTKKINTETTFDLYLFQSIPKGYKMDFIIRETSQLGVKKIIPVISNRVIGTTTQERTFRKIERWRRIAADSSRVSGREYTTEIGEIMRLEDAVKTDSNLSIFFWEQSTTPLRQIIQGTSLPKTGARIIIFIGPEGGYTEEEALLAKNCGAVPVSIGKRILRVETASVIATALTIYELENTQ